MSEKELADRLTVAEAEIEGLKAALHELVTGEPATKNVKTREFEDTKTGETFSQYERVGVEVNLSEPVLDLEMAQVAAEQLASEYLYYGRKEDGDFSREDVRALVKAGKLTPELIIEWFSAELRSRWDMVEEPRVTFPKTVIEQVEVDPNETA